MKTAKDLWKTYYRELRRKRNTNKIANCVIGYRSGSAAIIVNQDYTTITNCSFIEMGSIRSRLKFCWRYLRGKI